MKKLIIGTVFYSTILVLTIINFIHHIDPVDPVDPVDPINIILTVCLLFFCINDMITIITNYIHQRKNDSLTVIIINIEK